jgi:hypothetical protein
MRAKGYEDNLQPKEEIVEFERHLHKLDGVSQVKVVGVARPARIYIVASTDRSEEDIIRDVQRVGVDELGIVIDEQAILITRLGEEGHKASSFRPLLERVITANTKGSAWVKVVLAWPNGDLTEGVAPVGPAREGRAKGAVAAAILALKPILDPKGTKLYTDHVLVNQVGARESVMVASTFQDEDSDTPVVGSALAYDDVPSAAVRALLQSVNRKLEDFGKQPAKGHGTPNPLA